MLQATGLPQHLSNFVFCQYYFWEQKEPVFIAPEVGLTAPSSREPQSLVLFDNCKVKTLISVSSSAAGMMLPSHDMNGHEWSCFTTELVVP